MKTKLTMINFIIAIIISNNQRDLILSYTDKIKIMLMIMQKKTK